MQYFIERGVLWAEELVAEAPADGQSIDNESTDDEILKTKFAIERDAAARLAQPIDFNAIDDMPVDLVFLLLSPPDAGVEQESAAA